MHPLVCSEREKEKERHTKTPNNSSRPFYVLLVLPTMCWSSHHPILGVFAAVIIAKEERQSCSRLLITAPPRQCVPESRPVPRAGTQGGRGAPRRGALQVPRVYRYLLVSERKMEDELIRVWGRRGETSSLRPPCVKPEARGRLGEGGARPVLIGKLFFFLFFFLSSSLGS